MKLLIVLLISLGTLGCSNLIDTNPANKQLIYSVCDFFKPIYSDPSETDVELQLQIDAHNLRYLDCYLLYPSGD